MTKDLIDGILQRSIPTEVVNIDLLDKNPIQAPQREKMGISELAADFEKTGFVQPITVKRKVSRFTIIDGHRRLAACRLCGFTKVPVIVLDTTMSVTLLFLTLNRDSKAVNAAQLFYAWGHESPEDRPEFLSQISRPTRANITRMIEIFGHAEAVRLADGRLSPHIVKFVKDAMNIFVVDRFDAIPEKQVAKWIVAHSGTNHVNRLRRDPNRDRKETKRLHQAILLNTPFAVVKPGPKRKVA